MAVNLLTDAKVRTAKPRAKPYRLADGEGLFLYVPPTGVKSWQFRYKLHGKQHTLTLGKLTQLPLASARVKAQEARELAHAGTQLTAHRRAARLARRADAEGTFKAIATDWMAAEARRVKWTPAYRKEVEGSLRNHLSQLDALPLSGITARIAAALLRACEKTAPDMARKVQQRLRAILDYGVEQGIIERNPLPATRRGVRVERKNLPAVIDSEGIGAILRAADKAEACQGVKRAHTLVAFCVTRVSNAVEARWADIDFTTGTWTIPREEMKRRDANRGAFVIPIPPLLLGTLREWHRIDGDQAVFVCPGPRDLATHVTREAVEKFYRRTLKLSGAHSPHSWRSVLSTKARDAGKDGDAIEAQLDHAKKDKVAAAYDRAHLLERRRSLMTWYEETLIAARDGAKVIPLDKRMQSGRREAT